MGKRKKGACSTFAAWKVLRDGAWHRKSELRLMCGEQGDRRARDLRHADYGGWTIERKREGGESFYRIPIAELDANPKARACLNLDMKVENTHPVDQKRSVLLSQAELVFLLALLEDNAQLRDPKVKLLWDQTRSRLAYKLKMTLPEGLQDPFDLFDDDEEE